MYAPATAAQLEAIVALGLPAPANDLRYYVDPAAPTADGPGWTIEFTSAIAYMRGASKWSDVGPDFNVVREQVEEHGTDLVELDERLTTIFDDNEQDEDGIVEVTLDAALLVARPLVAAA
jgi:hypothetical protein